MLTKNLFQPSNLRAFFQTFEEYIQNPKEKVVILRHDVDRKPGNALKTARLEDELGIKATYFFRTIPHTFKPEIIKEIAGMGHEIGYHYENLSDPQITQINADEGERGKREEELVIRKENRGNRNEKKEKSEEELFEFAIDDFRLNLEKLRELYPVKTICMHGSPLSKWDNRDLWKRYNYQDFGIIAEPYFDVDFNEIFYVTDTGRKWNNSDASIRDRAGSIFDIEIKSTNHFIELIKQGLVPDKMMINVHPQRWTDNPIEWTKELVWQNVKNVVKRAMLWRAGLG